jgi:hypothetical protein
MSRKNPKYGNNPTFAGGSSFDSTSMVSGSSTSGYTAETRDTRVEDTNFYGQLTAAENYNAGREATAQRAEGLAKIIDAIGRFLGGK